MIVIHQTELKSFSDASVAREYFLTDMYENDNINVICDSSELEPDF